MHVIPCIEGAQTACRGRCSRAAGHDRAGRLELHAGGRARERWARLDHIHLYYEREAAEILGIPYDEVMQAALTPVAYTVGTEFKPAKRKPLETMTHWDGW